MVRGRIGDDRDPTDVVNVRRKVLLWRDAEVSGMEAADERARQRIARSGSARKSLLEPGDRTLNELTQFSAAETLRDGRQVEIRAQRPGDRDGLQAAIRRISSQSLYRRFFGVRREFSDKEASSFLDIDFVNQVALVVVAAEDSGPNIVGGGRYVVVNPGQAEVAFAVVDEYQGQGLGGALMRHLTKIARAAGLKELIAEVLAENAPMLKVFEKCGLPMRMQREHDVVHVVMQLV
jgi:RimJ/RimL family protein N-acetyltransferase